MSLNVQSSFAAGELDPALHERTNLEKYHSGLATGRNAIIGKTGRLVSKPGSRNFRKTKNNNQKVLVHALSYSGGFLEFGPLYVRHWTINPENLDVFQLKGDFVHDITEAQLPYVQFVDIAAGKVMIFLMGKAVKLLVIGEGFTLDTGFTTEANIFDIPAAPTYVSNTVTGTGYDTDYAITFVYGGEESEMVETATGKTIINAGEKNIIVVNCGVYATVSPKAQEIRVYRRPRDAGAYGYIGSSSAFTHPGSDLIATFTDVGAGADYAHSPPTFNQGIRDLGFTDPTDIEGQSGCIYQQRLLMSYKDKIFTSRTGFPFNFTREYPLSADSSLALKISTRANVNVIHMINSDGLVVFTYDGIYVHTGILSPTNLSLEKKGSWVIEPSVPPIAIPGGVLFVDSLTNTVRQLLFSQEAGTYMAEELSIFSNHLFENVTVKSWAFQDGNFPLLWVVFSDGTSASFTYEREHKMRAWTRHDSKYPIEYVDATVKGAYIETSVIYPLAGELVTIVNKDGQRYIEIGVPRYPTAQLQEANDQADMSQSIAAMDSMATWQFVVNENRFSTGVVQVVITLDPVTPGVWDGPLELVCDGTIFSATLNADGEAFIAGTIFRHFNPSDGTAVDLEITSVTDNYTCLVTPTAEFPSAYADDVKLYLTKNILTKQWNFWKSNAAGYPTKHTSPGGGKIFTVTPKVGGVWNGTLIIDSDTQSFFKAANAIYLGMFLYYLTDGGVWIEMQITAITTDKIIEVMPSSTFPSGEASDITIYKMIRSTFDVDHLEGEDVAVIVDGYVIASPNNDVETYDTVTVTDGTVTLPNSMRGAIIHVGRPYVMDIETLDIDTVDQHPVLFESKTVNKVYVKIYNTRGLFVANTFPANDSVIGMIDVEEIDVGDADPITANRYPRPRSKRLEVSLPGDWRSEGKICLRQVDPVHFEILSITPDLEELVRSRL